MPLSWNEIRERSIRFANEWAEEYREEAEAKTFWDQFFHIFGIERRRLASFEQQVQKLSGQRGFIDLFWPGVLLAEHKSRGKDLDSAYAQALDYFSGLSDKELPRYVIVSDFAQFHLYDLDAQTHTQFPLSALPEHIQTFGFIAGYENRVYKEQDPVNMQAAHKLAQLHDGLREIGYDGYDLEVYLVRILFCLFAEDTGIFLPRGAFQEFIQQRTSIDGSDLAARLAELFEVLNTPDTKRLKLRDEQLAAFPYINGQLFAERLRIAAFDSRLRTLLLDCCELDWGQVSPAIFGSLFQGIMDKDLRRNLGAHYTCEQNILKLIGPLFLEQLRAEFTRLSQDRSTQKQARLKRFHEQLSRLHFFDPACGCGNFLIIAYRELRLLELDLIRELYAVEMSQQLSLDAVDQYVKVNVDQFHGIEIEEWPAQIAKTAMWLMDHQMNIAISKEFGNAFVRIPLVKSANIVHGNALQLDWTQVIAPAQCSYILGNPPFVGGRWMSKEQRADHERVHAGNKSSGLLDFVSGWYVKATQFMQHNPVIETAFVSTNSITQGEQVGALWPGLLAKGVHINFAHRTFQWKSDAPGAAAVHCVIVGFALQEREIKRLFSYELTQGKLVETTVSNINPYLTEGPDVILLRRQLPLCDAPKMVSGNKPIDDGNYLFTPEEKASFLDLEPKAAPFFKRWLGGREFLNGIERWYLWLGECSPQELRNLPHCMKRVEAVKKFRQNSKSAPTQRLANMPRRFHTEFIPTGPYIALPQVSSERREYIPMAFLGADTLCGDKLRLIDNATLYHLGVLCSVMHMAWTRQVCGRLKSDYQYSALIVYNNFPWPEPTDAQRVQIEKTAQAILDARANHPEATLADLYDPLAMPHDLRKAHQANDRAVDAAYGKHGFTTEAQRVGFLFQRYQSLA
ncbi:DNA methyltransferase [Thiorhodospira sibirica]|uniref:DNA methyltransferase n=1 Tax=Thiorhodospira sibirica TaxID=154347 RepID=UPI00022C406F|nr:DNA methyltransferase [Thiorhodospira sibirica]